MRISSRTRTNQTIWMILPIEYGYAREIVRGAAQTFHAAGWPLRVCPDSEPRLPIPKEVAGFITMTPLGWLTELAKIDTRPVVNVSGRMPWERMPCPSVLPDNHAAGRLAAQHLLERGHTKFAFVELGDVHFDIERGSGFRDAVAERGHECLWIERKHSSLKPAAVAKWIRELPVPCGCLASDDAVAAHVLAGCGEAGRNVPAELAVVGINNDDLSCLTADPTLTSVDLNAAAIGAAAARLLLELIGGGVPPSEAQRIAPRGIVVRESSDTLVDTDPLVREADEIMRQRIAHPPSLEQIAAQCRATRRTLDRRFARSLGCSPADHLMRLRLEHARSLLSHSGLSLDEIASRSGFASVKYFKRRFRELLGSDPETLLDG